MVSISRRLFCPDPAIPNLIYLAVDKAAVCNKSLKIYRSDLESASHLGKKLLVLIPKRVYVERYEREGQPIAGL